MAAVLELITPLLRIDLDTLGNAQHWTLQTMQAALDHTIDNWLHTFNSQDNWDERCVTPAVLGWQNYFVQTGSTRHGLSMDVVRRKHQRRMQDSWQKARTNWAVAFRDEAKHFYARMLTVSAFYAKDVQLFLTLMGLGLRNYVGPFGMHLMALCGNQRIYEHLGINSSVVYLSFPAPPIIPSGVRQMFAHSLLGVLGRDVYGALRLNKAPIVNDQLDAILGSYLGGAYTGFMHVEPAPAGWQLHTKIIGAPTAKAPQAFDFHVPVPRLEPPLSSGLVLPDVFLYTRAETYPLASMTLTLEAMFTPDVSAEVQVKRSDTAEGLVDFRLVEGVTVNLPVLEPGLTWQLRLYLSTAPDELPPLWFRGRLWCTDDHGNESNHAFWSIAGAALTALPFSINKPLPNFPDSDSLFVPDLFIYATEALTPITMGHLSMGLAITNGGDVFVQLKRSDDTGDGITLNTSLGTVYDLPVPPPGVTWQLLVLVLKSPDDFEGAFFAGDWWVEDATGALSNQARWRLSCVRIL